MKDHRPARTTQTQTQDRVAIEQSCATDDEEYDADEFHDRSVGDGSLDDPAPDEFALPRISSPAKFFVKLKRKLSNLGVRYERLTRKGPEGEAPPCFKLEGAKKGQQDYDMWLTMASLTSDVPHRYDMPGEPNYCRDCTVHFRHKAIQLGACIFSNVVFETASNNGENEVVGVSRSPKVLPAGYRVFREMVVDELAIEEQESATSPT